MCAADSGSFVGRAGLMHAPSAGCCASPLPLLTRTVGAWAAGPSRRADSGPIAPHGPEGGRSPGHLA